MIIKYPLPHGNLKQFPCQMIFFALQKISFPLIFT